jgi:hypothetical protein
MYRSPYITTAKFVNLTTTLPRLEHHAMNTHRIGTEFFSRFYPGSVSLVSAFLLRAIRAEDLLSQHRNRYVSLLSRISGDDYYNIIIMTIKCSLLFSFLPEGVRHLLLRLAPPIIHV